MKKSQVSQPEDQTNQPEIPSVWDALQKPNGAVKMLYDVSFIIGTCRAAAEHSNYDLFGALTIAQRELAYALGEIEEVTRDVSYPEIELNF